MHELLLSKRGESEKYRPHRLAAPLQHQGGAVQKAAELPLSHSQGSEGRVASQGNEAADGASEGHQLLSERTAQEELLGQPPTQPETRPASEGKDQAGINSSAPAAAKGSVK